MIRPRTILAIGAGLAIVAGIAGIALGRAAAPHHAAHPVRPDTTTPADRGATGASTPAASIPPLTPGGGEIYVDVPATITAVDDTGNTTYLQATISELTQLPVSDAAALIATTPALAGYQDVYEAHVTIQLLAGDATFSRATLAQFTITVHPGDDPPLSSDALTSSGCAGLPNTPARLRQGDTLNWCVHAFRRPDGATPIGGQYQTSTGAYSGALIWASRAFTDTSPIP